MLTGLLAIVHCGDGRQDLVDPTKLVFNNYKKNDACSIVDGSYHFVVTATNTKTSKVLLVPTNLQQPSLFSCLIY